MCLVVAATTHWHGYKDDEEEDDDDVEDGGSGDVDCDGRWYEKHVLMAECGNGGR